MTVSSRFATAPGSLTVAVLAALALLAARPAAADSYVYEGRLEDRGQPANGHYDLRLTAYPDVKLGATLAAPISFDHVLVENGRFRLEFDAPLAGQDHVWLALAVRDASAEGAYTEISGRSKAIAAPLIGACWSSTGDSGSNPATNFLGTTDAQPLVLRTANVQSLRVEPSSVLFNGAPITTNLIAGSSANGVTEGVRGAVIAGGGVPIGSSDPIHFDEAPNRVSDDYGSIGGGYANRAGNDAGTTSDRAFATVAGGIGNVASGNRSTVGGGDGNFANGFVSTVAGGIDNTALGEQSTVAGGDGNAAFEAQSTVAGGRFNEARGGQSSIGGGAGNVASGFASTVAGGLNNTASGFSSTASSGSLNCAGGALSWAGGNRAKVRPGDGGATAGVGCNGVATVAAADGDLGTFVWADSQSSDFVSRGPDAFLVRAQNGMTLQRASGVVQAPLGYLNVIRAASGLTPAASPDPTAVAVFENDDGANLFLISGGTGNKGIRFGDASSATQGAVAYTPTHNMQFRTNGNIVRMILGSNGVLTLPALAAAGVTPLCHNAGGQIASCSSSARYKEAVADLELGLEAILRLRPVGYRWKDGGSEDVGFVAEEVAQIDPRLVTRNASGEIEGVRYERLSALLANAVQQLAAQDSLQAERVDALTTENAELKARLQKIEAHLGLDGAR